MKELLPWPGEHLFSSFFFSFFWTLWRIKWFLLIMLQQYECRNVVAWPNGSVEGVTFEEVLIKIEDNDPRRTGGTFSY